MRIMSRALIVLGTACLIVTAAPAVAQVQRGVIHGTVHDPSGAVLPGAIVQLTSEVGAPRDAATAAVVIIDSRISIRAATHCASPSISLRRWCAPT